MAVSQQTQAQFREMPAGPDRLLTRTLDCVDNVFAWYDAPIFLAYLVNRYEIVSPSAKPLSISTASSEQLLARSIAVEGSSSFGSLDPFTIPHMVIAARMLHAAGSELFIEDAETEGELRNTLGLYKSLMYTQVATQLIKHVVSRQRPDGSDNKSFVSGHTSITFTAGAYLQRETDDALCNWDALAEKPLLRSTLRISSAAILYGWSGYVGYSRMRDNKHYLTDVVVGALLGAVIGNLVYDGVNGDEALQLPSLAVWADERGPILSLQLQF